MAEAKNELEGDANALDDHGTDNAAGLAILKRLRDAGFDSDDEKLAVVLGRPVEEVAEWMRGEGRLDDDIIMKARGIAQERGIDVE